ncbi:MAG: phosphate transporter permease subunit PstC [Actinomycetota bacterium]|jgi:phosphate transport system permease protein
MTAEAPYQATPRRKLVVKPSTVPDKVFFSIATAAAYSAIVITSAILIFLVLRAWPAFESQGVLNFIFGSGWDTSLDPIVLHIGPMLWGSFLVATIGVIFAIPMAISIAYFIEFIAPKALAKSATILVDLLAAIPSVVIGLWGVSLFSTVAAGWAQELNSVLGWLPFFANNAGNFLRSPFIAGLVVAVMIVPIIASITREIFSQMDQEIIKASLALGGNRESTFRKVILPTAAGGVVGGVLLGLGRALGETVAIFFVLNLVYDDFNFYQILEPKGGAVASLILAKFGEATPAEIAGLMAAGVVLFVATLIINAIASYIVAKAQPWRN